MKKLLLVIMSIIMVLSLCACGGKGAGGNGGLLSSEPTEQQNEVISTYVNILNALESYLEDGDISIYDVENEVDVEGCKALEYCYKTIQDLESVDKWIGTEYISDTRTRQEILDSFTVVKDVKLQDTVVSLDFLGNEIGSAESGFYTYNENGKILEDYKSRLDCIFISDNFDNIALKVVMESYEIVGTYICTYDEDGNLEYMENDAERITPLYDNAGKMTSIERLEADDGTKKNYSLNYDEQGRLNKIEHTYFRKINKFGEEEKDVDTYNFTYDDNNNLLKEESVHQFFVDNEKGFEETTYTNYVYDEKGNMISAVKNSSEGYKWQLTVNYDDNGSLVTYNYEYIDTDGKVTNMYKQERTYGDLYVYNPNK